MRAVIGRTLLVIGALSAAWAAWVSMANGVAIDLFGLRISSRAPLRPLAAAAVAVALAFVIGGPSVADDVKRAFGRATPGAIRWALAGLILVVGVIGNAGAATGADSYGYISQAEVWLKGELSIPQPAALQVPWPDGPSTFAPLGYRPSPARDAIVPTYAPGLPMLMAVSKLAAGQCAIRAVVPLTAALLVLVTFSIGRRMYSDQVGAAAAWLIASSAIVLNMLMWPMSDIPVAAFWALAILGCLIGSPRAVFGAGLSAAVAILIRPNLVHLAGIMAVWLIVRELRSRGNRSAIWRAAQFGLPVASSCVVVAILNDRLYGSPTSSGYGNLDSLFSARNVSQNLALYTTWMLQSQTPLALLGLLALWMPARFLRRAKVRGRALLALIALGVIVCYLFYLPFEAWWYLRFLLPCWPAIAISSAWLLSRGPAYTYGASAKAILVAVGLFGAWYAYDSSVFTLAEGERRFISAAYLVRNVTEPNSMIFSMQHSGSVRYYGERMSLRYDFLDEEWLDGSVRWLEERGIRSYFLLEDWERERFVQRFKPRNALGGLEDDPVFEFRGAGGARAFLFSAQRGEVHAPTLVIRDATRPRLPSCPSPGPQPTLLP
jgi:hypothetical protein